ncbi:hypothetical protein PL8927_750075 [Planktothrix serta PCC 8927]|uniref:Uncharacterized protein n=1 Tax=Planktothrix serta PCC 8927 TaxID=671068 RepID=A0A7Z9BU90_9CYAN|nr:hypothetical protein PL8927_750075 [Planktothrix serta PCC 8927]
MRITTNIYLRYGLTIVKIDFALFSTFASLFISKDVQLDGSYEKKHTSKKYSLRFFTREYKEHWKWVKFAWFDNTVKPPYNTPENYNSIPF